jgi:hypothetical protein
MRKTHFLSGKRALWIPLLIAAASLLTMGFVVAVRSDGCKHVEGRLFNSPGPDLPGRMTGKISGDYWIDVGAFCFNDENSPVTFICSTSRVDGKHGSLYFNEYSAMDFSEDLGPNGAVLMVVQSGTDDWEGATGHIILSGFFHLSDSQGEWDYQGEVCTP